MFYSPRNVIMVCDDTTNIIWDIVLDRRYYCFVKKISDDLGELVVDDQVTNNIIYRQFFHFPDEINKDTIKTWSKTWKKELVEFVDERYVKIYGGENEV